MYMRLNLKRNKKTIKSRKYKTKNSRKTRQSKKSKKLRKARTKSAHFNKRGGVKVNGSVPVWNDYETLIEQGKITDDADCPLCLQKFTDTRDQAIYRSGCCKVLFHNDCLLSMCERKDREDKVQTQRRIAGQEFRDIITNCPICRFDNIDSECTDVYAFRRKELGDPNDAPVFTKLSKHIIDIYKNQPDIFPIKEEEIAYINRNIS